MNRDLLESSPGCTARYVVSTSCSAISKGNGSKYTQKTSTERGYTRSATSKGRRIEPTALWSQDPAVRPVVLVVQCIKKKNSRDTQDNGDRKEVFRAPKSCWDGNAGPQVQYLREIIPNIRGKIRRQNGVFPTRNPSG